MTRFKIQSHDDREKMVTALANSGYKVWVEEKAHLYQKEYYVCVEGGEMLPINQRTTLTFNGQVANVIDDLEHLRNTNDKLVSSLKELLN